MRRLATWIGTSLALLTVVLASGPAPARADVVFLATGDSLVFGFDPSHAPSTVPSYGDQGWVKIVADGLASSNGGVRPTVANYAIPGELTATYLTAVSPPGWTARGWQLNQHYPDGDTPQYNAVLNRIASAHAAGDTIGYVSMVFGANDALFLVNTPDFLTATPEQQQAMLALTIGNAQSRYLTVLSALKTAAPEAKFLLPGYYNPFPSAAPQHALFQSVSDAFNQFIAGAAAATGSTYIDLAAPFVGRELELTNIGNFDTHPNQAGYQVIAGAFNRTLSPTAVPEPGSLALMGLGLIGGVGIYRRRCARAA